MENKKVIYYEDELNDEFSEAKIKPRRIDENYVYMHKNPFWNFCSILVQNVFSMPIKVLYSKLKFRHKFVGKKNLNHIKNKAISYMQIILKLLQILLFQALQISLKEIF